MRLLLLEDDPLLGEGLADYLRAEGHVVDWCRSLGALRALEPGPFDAWLVDWQLPDGSGIHWLRQRRAQGETTAALVLTARDRLQQRIEGLDAGADDYVTKPFSPKELVARVRAVLRRRSPHLAAEEVEIGSLRVNPVTHRAEAAGAPLELGPTEFRLLFFFMTHPERVFSRAQLLDDVWGDHVFIEERTVDVHIRRLRAALEASGEDARVETVRGTGYRFRGQ